jgi:hypothetical protein
MSKIFKPVTQVQQKVSAGTWFFYQPCQEFTNKFRLISP